MVEIYWTHEAKTRLKEIHDYIAQHNKAAAKNVVTSIRQKAQLLKTFPKLGDVYPDIPKRGIRVIYYLDLVTLCRLRSW